MTESDELLEIRKGKEKIYKKYEGSIPDYLLDHFDELELELIEKEKKKLEESKTKKEKEKEFWDNSRTEIVKRLKRVPKGVEPKYDEPPRAEERVEERKGHDFDEKMIIAACGERLDAFAHYYFPHYLKKPNSEFHEFLYSILNSELNTNAKWAIAAPRGNAKSSVVSAIFPLWCTVYNKKKFIIILSDTAGQAEDFLSDIKRELENNEILKADFPYACGKGPLWRSDEIITNNDVKIKALGSGNKIRGRRFGIYRPGLVLLDDIENSEMVRSETQRDSIRNEWFNKDVLYAGGESGTTTDFFVVGTILGKHSLLNALLTPAEYPDWKSRKFKAVYKFSESSLWEEWEKLYKNHFDVNRENTARHFFEQHKEEMLYDTEVLWPEGDPYYSLMIDKIRDPRGFASEKMNEAIDPSSVYVTKEDLHWEGFRRPKIASMLKKAMRFGAIDPSVGKKKKKGDPSVIITIARDTKTGMLFVEDINTKRRPVEDQIETILDLHDEYKYKLFAVETNAFQYVVSETLRKKARAEGRYIPIKEVDQYRDKKMRIEGIVPFLIDGTFVFDSDKYHTDQMYRTGVDRICSYTGEGDEEDDEFDCLSTVFEIAKRPRFKLLTAQTEH